MTETLAEYAQRTRPSRARGWLHALPDGDDVFPDDFVAGLAGRAVGDTVHLTTAQLDQIYPSTKLDPVEAGPAVIDECMFDFYDGEDGEGVLVYVEIIDGTVTDAGADFTVAAMHHPRDVYAGPGTPLRHVMDILQGEFDVGAIADARRELLRDTGVDEGDQWLYSAPPWRGRQWWDTCPKEFWDTYCGGIEAANRALHGAGRNRDFPQPSVSMHGNDEYIALAARDLIGTAAGWTQDSYERVARPYAQATGHKLHPEDDLHADSARAHAVHAMTDSTVSRTAERREQTAIGYDETWQRDIGYAVPAYCDHPDCGVEIHRGLDYVCGDAAGGGRHGCGLHFCHSHLGSAYRSNGFEGLTDENGELLPDMCERCVERHEHPERDVEPFTPKAECLKTLSESAQEFIAESIREHGGHVSCIGPEAWEAACDCKWSSYHYDCVDDDEARWAHDGHLASEIVKAIGGRPLGFQVQSLSAEHRDSAWRDRFNARWHYDGGWIRAGEQDEASSFGLRPGEQFGPFTKDNSCSYCLQLHPPEICPVLSGNTVGFVVSDYCTAPNATHADTADVNPR